MSHFASVLASVVPSQPVNYEGFPTFDRALRDQVRNYLRTGTLSGTFYVGASQLAAETIATLRRFADQDAHALAGEVVLAREDGYMRTLPIVALAVLSGVPDKSAFRAAAAQVLRIPRDVAQFIEICKSGAIPDAQKFAGCRIAPVRAFCEKLSEYHAIKGTQDRKISLTDVVRLAHPTPSNDQTRELLGWLSGHVKGSSVRLNPQVVALEALKRTSVPAEQVRLIREGRLPYEAVTAVIAKPAIEVWTALLEQAPTFNLLRNLRTFTRHGVFADSANVELAVAKLSRSGALRQARILPFQCFTAWKSYSQEADADPRIVAALSDAIESSVGNLPLLNGRVAIAPDVSGSMQYCFTNKEQTTSAAEVAGIFAAGLLKQCPNARVLPFESRVVPLALNPRDSVLANAQAIASIGGGGTSLSAPVEKLRLERDKVDLFVGITDNEEWVGRGFLEAWRQYRAEVSPTAKAVLVTVVPTPHSPVPDTEPDVHFVHGWSDAVMRYVAEVSGLCKEYRATEDDAAVVVEG